MRRQSQNRSYPPRWGSTGLVQTAAESVVARQYRREQENRDIQRLHRE